MTISSLVRTVGPIIGNGSFSAFPFTFKIFATSELTLIATDSGVDRAPLVLGTDYSVVLNTDQNAAPGGTITYRVASVITNIPVNTTLNGTSNVSNLQPINLTNNGGFFPAVINAGLDRLTILVQQIARTVGVSLQFPVSDGTLSGVLPNKVTRALKLLGFDTNGVPTVSNLTIAQIEAIATSGVNANMFYGAATTGTGDALVAAVGLPVTGYAPGQVFNIITSAANTLTNPTANFGGGIKNIKQLGAAGKIPLIGANCYFSGYVARFIYDGTDLVLANPWLLAIGMASINTGTDLTGTDSVNTYAQVDAYQPQSGMGAVGASSVPGISASTSRGTGIAPVNNNTADLVGGVTMYGYIAGAYLAAAAAVGRVVGVTAANLGGQWELWTKKDNGVLTLGATMSNTQVMDFVNTPTVAGVALSFFKTVKRQVFNSNATYTPDPNMLYCDIEGVGGGGGGGGCPNTGSFFMAGSGGGSGGYSKIRASKATIGASQSVTIGASGSAGSNTGGNGGTGGTTSVGSLISASGGTGGTGSIINSASCLSGGVAGVGSLGDINRRGAPGGISSGNSAAATTWSGFGGNSYWGGGGVGVGGNTSTATAGDDGQTNSGGGGGGGVATAGTGRTGGVGGSGLVIITEYCSQ